jgi:hypothetical protein
MRLRVIALVGVAGLPLLIAGMLLHDTRLCLVAAALSGVAAVLYAVLSLR